MKHLISILIILSSTMVFAESKRKQHRKSIKPFKLHCSELLNGKYSSKSRYEAKEAFFTITVNPKAKEANLNGEMYLKGNEHASDGDYKKIFSHFSERYRIVEKNGVVALNALEKNFIFTCGKNWDSPCKNWDSFKYDRRTKEARFKQSWTYSKPFKKSETIEELSIHLKCEEL